MSKIRARLSAAALAVATGITLASSVATPAEAETKWTRITVGDWRCSAVGGGSVKAVQFGAVPAVTSVPYTTGNSGSIQVIYTPGGSKVRFAGVAWCKPWWRPYSTKVDWVQDVWFYGQASVNA